MLGVVGFSQPPPTAIAQVPSTASMTPALGADSRCEVWRAQSDDPVALVSETHAGCAINVRSCDEVLFGSTLLAEPPGADDSVAALVNATTAAYEAIFALLDRSPQRHLIRVWNYLPQINREADGDERYRHFNAARQAAFRKAGKSTVGTVPAASALGSPPGSPISIYFLAARESPTMIENPRQTSAYHYPPKFGVHSPVFSRACLLSKSAGTSLFISGTASIVGYETLHLGDVIAQTRETLANIEALLGEANRMVGAARYRLDDLKLKVYVRRPSDLPAIQRTLSAMLSPSTAILYLQADICREDLLVEIEATGDS